MTTALVTGAAGFIGSHVCEDLARSGWRVVGVDNFAPFYPRAEKEANLAEMIPEAREHFFEADIRDEPRMAELLAEHQVDLVVHLAAMAGVRPSIEQPTTYMDVNVGGTVSLLEAARKAGVKRFIFASSSSVYGSRNTLPFREDQPVQTPMSPYAASKIAGEAICYTYHHLHHIPITCLRFFTVYGPRQRPDLAINKFVRLMFADEPLPVYGDGTSSRDYTFISDIVAGVRAAAERDLGFAIINLGNSQPVNLDELIRALESVTGLTAKIEHLPSQPGDMQHTCADITRAQMLLDWRPTTPLEDGLRLFVEWWKRRRSSRV
jgi:UDP-glucuronate 4-epimerase